MNRAYSLLKVQSFSGKSRTFQGVATTPEVDRVGDIVDPLGVEFTNPLVLLHQHDSDRPVGTVRFERPTKDGIKFEASIPHIDEPGPLKDRVDTAWGEVKAGLVRAVSIGFRVINDGVELLKSGGVKYTATEVLELSLVSVPANAGAVITSVKSLAEFDKAHLNPAERPAQEIKSIDRASLAATGKKEGTVVRLDPPPGVTGKSQLKTRPKEGNEMKTIAEQIAALEAKRAANAARMEEVMTKSMDEGRSTDDAESEEFDGLEAELSAIDKDLDRLRKLEKAKLSTAKVIQKVDGEKAGSDARDTRSRIQVTSPLPKGVGFARLLAARFMSMQDHVPPADIALSKGWGEDIAAVLRTPKNVLKAAVAAANTTDSTWAGPLVTYQNLTNEFIELLRANSILSRIPGLRHVPFNVKVPRETGEMTGYWVPQGSPKPLTAGAFDTVTLDFTKVAGITLQTQELLRFSQPNSETLLVNSLTKAINKLIDNDFLDPSKAAVSGESPASITNGTSAITASGQTVDAFRADFADLLAQYTGSNYSLSDLVLVMSQTQAMRLSLLRTDFAAREFPDINKDGGFLEGVPVITSENIAANGGSPADGRIIVALAANSILLADDGGVEVDVSTEASIQADGAPDSPATASTVMISLWQRNMVGIRCERYVNWVKARTGAAVYISGANYG